MQERLFKFYLPAVLFLVSFTIYRITVCPTFFWGDGIELATCARVLGIAHPTGYPLFTMLGRLFLAVPLATAAFRINLFCALIMSLNVLLIFYLVKQIAHSASIAQKLSHSALNGIAAGVALAFALFRAPWHHATFTEVYSLNLFFFLLIVYVFFSFWRQADIRKLVLFFFLLGLGLSHHLLTVCLLPLAMLSLLQLRKLLRESQEPKAAGRRPLANCLLLAIVMFLLGLTPYFYLNIRAKKNPPINWGDPQNRRNLLWVISGGQFKQYRLLQPQPGQKFTVTSYLEFVYHRTGDYLNWLYRQAFAGLGTALGVKLIVYIITGLLVIIGLIKLVGKNYAVFVGLVSPLIVNLVLIYLYNIPDIEDYYLSTLPFIWIIAAVGLICLLSWLIMVLRKPAANYLFCLFLLIPVALVSLNFSRVNKSNYYVAEDYGRNALSTVKPASLILTGGDNDIYPIWYMQEVERWRTDVMVIGSNFIFSGWYQRYFESHPRPGLSWHVEQREPTTDVAFFDALRQWIIEPNIGRFPVYIFYLHPYLLNFYTIKPVAQLLPVSVQNETEAIFDYRFLPSPVVYEIEQKKLAKGKEE